MADEGAASAASLCVRRLGNLALALQHIDNAIKLHMVMPSLIVHGRVLVRTGLQLLERGDLSGARARPSVSHTLQHPRAAKFRPSAMLC